MGSKWSKGILVTLGMIVGLSNINLLAETNLIQNPGFEVAAEEWSPGELPQGWTMWKFETLKEGELILDSQVKHKGNYSVRFSNATHGLAQHIRVKAGEIYDFSCYFKTNLTKGGFGFSVQWIDAEGKWVWREAFEHEKGKPWVRDGKVAISHRSNWYGIRDWQKAELLGIRAPETAVIARVAIDPIFGARGEFWVDEVVMEKTTIVGSLSLPRQWQVFGPWTRDDGLPSLEALKTIPSQLDIAGHKLSPQTVQVEDAFNRFDLATLIGGTEIGRTAFVFVPFSLPTAGEVTLGMGADWWLQAWLNGELIMDTTEDGNVSWPPTASDHMVTVHLNKGEHVLAVRFISGSGSSILALGGSDDLRRGRPLFPLFKDEPVPGGNLVANCGFESGEIGEPFIPSGWKSGKGRARFQKGELTAQTRAPISGSRSLEINTMHSGPVSRKLYVPLSVDIDTLYRFAFKAHHLEGDGYVSVSLRNSPDEGFDTVLVKGIGMDNKRRAIKRGQLGTGSRYTFFDSPTPFLVIQTRGPVHVILDDIYVIPVDRDKIWRFWQDQRAPWRYDWETLSETIVTPHTPWARPLAGGSLKVLALMPRREHRQTVELAQRLSMQFTPIFFEFPRDRPGAPSFLGYDYWIYDADGAPQLFRKEADTLKRLAQPVDCIIIAELNVCALSPHLVEMILNQVYEGAGLVITGCRFARLNLPGFKEGPWARALNEKNKTTEEIDWVKIGSASVHHYEACVHHDPMTAFYQYGKGRIAFWSDHLNQARASLEANLPYFIKSMLWASRRLPDVRIRDIELPGSPMGVLAARVKREALPGTIKVAINAVSPLLTETLVVGWIENFLGDEPIPLTSATFNSHLPGVTFDIPRLPAGRHHIHFQIKQGNKIQDWSTAVLEVTSPMGIKAIELNRKNLLFTVGDLVSGQVVLTSPLKPDQRLLLHLTDADGRLWAMKEVSAEASAGSAKIEFALKTEAAVVLMHQLRAEIFDPLGSVANAKVEFAVVRSPAWYENFFQYQLWCVPNTLLAGRELRKHGITSDMGASHRNKALNNIRSVPRAGRHWWTEVREPGVFFPGHRARVVGEKDAPIRYPCLLLPEFRAQVAEKIKADVTPHLRFGPLAYDLAHEWNLRDYGFLLGPVDFCFCTYCLESFRRFTHAEHGSIAELNASWGTDFEKWEEVTPIILPEALEVNQIPRWIDHRRHMDRIFANHFKFKMEVLHRLDPHAQGNVDNVRVGLTVLDSFSGVDFWLLLHDAALTGAAWPSPYITSFVSYGERSHMFIGRGSFWHPNVFTGDENLFRLRMGNQPWQRLLQGLHGYAYYPGFFFGAPCQIHLPVLKADLTTGKIAQIVNTSVAQIRTGIDRLIFESKRLDSGIAVLYSRSSEHAATAWQTLHTNNSLVAKISPPTQMGFYYTALNALGYRFMALSEDQVAGGALTKGGFRLLILPFSQAISTDAVEQIREFVKGGGYLLADIRPGIGDQHGRPGTVGHLDDIFGIQHQTAYNVFEPTVDAIIATGMIGKIDLPDTLSRALTGPPVKVTSASVLGKGRRSNMPAFLVNHFGQGKAILKNFVLQGVDDNALQMMSSLLTAFDLKPLFGLKELEVRRLQPLATRQVPKEAPTEEIPWEEAIAAPEGYVVHIGVTRPTLAHFVNDQSHIFGLWYPLRRGIGTERLLITPPAPGHIYCLKTNAYLGWHERFEVSMDLEGLALFASVPYRIQQPSLTLTRAISSEGLPIIYCLAQIHPDEAARQNHIVKFRIFAPDGTEWSDFAATSTANAGTAEHRFVLPLNAPRGRWKVEVREAISGLAETKSIEL